MQFHSFLIQTYRIIPTEYLSSPALKDIHSQVFIPHGYTDDIPHGCRKSFTLMGKVKSCLQHFNYLDLFTSNALFLVHNLIFQVFLSILTAFVQTLGESRCKCI